MEGEDEEEDARLLSLGPDCGVRYRIDEQALPWNKGGPSELFDWLLSSLDAVAAVLECGSPELFFDAARWSMARVTETESYEFVHGPTGLRSLHDARTYEHKGADAARAAVAARYVRRLRRFRELLEAPAPLRFVHVVDNENEMNLRPPPSRDVIQRVRGLLATRHHIVIVHDGDFADSSELAVGGVAFIDTRQFHLRTQEMGSAQGELVREEREPAGWRRAHLDWERLLLAVNEAQPSSLSDAQPSSKLKQYPTRLEFEALPADGDDVSPEDIYHAAVSVSLPGVLWRGWRAEPLFFGIEKLIVIVRCCDEDGGSADDVLACLQNLKSVQSAKLLSAAQGADEFALCSGLFSVQATSICDLDLPCIGVEAAAALIRHGWATVNDWMPPDVVGKAASTIAESMAARSEGRSDGVDWRMPQPRNARADVATWLKAGQRPASDRVFAEQVLLKFDALAGDLRALMAGIEGRLELQLACYPASQGARYRRHTDANADGRPSSAERKVTCILYLNPAWAKEHAGCLRLTSADHEMGTAGGVVDIEPIGGVLLCFLSGAMAHEVLPTQADRFAITAWVA